MYLLHALLHDNEEYILLFYIEESFTTSIVLFVMFNPNSVQSNPGIRECQRILREAKSDVASIQRDLKMDRKPSSTDNTLYRYYCEAFLVFHHMQHPGAVEALTVS